MGAAARAGTSGRGLAARLGTEPLVGDLRHLLLGAAPFPCVMNSFAADEEPGGVAPRHGSDRRFTSAEQPGRERAVRPAASARPGPRLQALREGGAATRFSDSWRSLRAPRRSQSAPTRRRSPRRTREGTAQANAAASSPARPRARPRSDHAGVLSGRAPPPTRPARQAGPTAGTTAPGRPRFRWRPFAPRRY